ncbi:PRC-barrel domain-containing protein [Nitrospira sp. BLG_2]|uniref:PRC-barrel domain containing protein n=1 Tax=Nitrospira sp. BLG_2 TaxID=3397507 RepID=UPI003B9AC7B8
MKQFRRVRDIAALTLSAIDGQMGSISELYFDDQSWTVRYLVINTGGWLSWRNVLLAPLAVAGIDDADASMRINLRKEQIEQAPPIEEAKPISRQYEEAYYEHFRWAPYWQAGTTFLGTPIPYPEPLPINLDEPVFSESPEESHLRSSVEVTGYGIHAQDGEIGHIEDLVIDDEDWKVRYVEVNTRNWLPGKKALVQTARIKHINWHSRSVTMSLTRQAIQSAPAYDPSMLITPDYEIQLFKHYGKMAA